MQKIVLDTNVIVSALISNSIPTKILFELVLTRKVQTCLSEAVFAEYVEVLRRDRFAKYGNFQAKAEVVLTKFRETSVFYLPEIKIDILNDPNDNKFLELAMASSADFLITGNSIHFTMTDFENTKILNPTDCWENYALRD